MTSLRGKFRESEKEPSKPKSEACGAYGCPMAGSICGTTHPTENTQWLCRFHFGEPIEAWQEITRKVHAMSYPK